LSFQNTLKKGSKIADNKKSAKFDQIKSPQLCFDFSDVSLDYRTIWVTKKKTYNMIDGDQW